MGKVRRWCPSRLGIGAEQAVQPVHRVAGVDVHASGRCEPAPRGAAEIGRGEGGDVDRRLGGTSRTCHRTGGDLEDRGVRGQATILDADPHSGPVAESSGPQCGLDVDQSQPRLVMCRTEFHRTLIGQRQRQRVVECRGADVDDVDQVEVEQVPPQPESGGIGERHEVDHVDGLLPAGEPGLGVTGPIDHISLVDAVARVHRDVVHGGIGRAAQLLEPPPSGRAFDRTHPVRAAMNRGEQLGVGIRVRQTHRTLCHNRFPEAGAAGVHEQ